MFIAIIRCRRVEIIEGMSAAQARQLKEILDGYIAVQAQTIKDNYYTKAQVDEKVDKLEQTIRHIAGNADRYFKRIAEDLYK